jgi:hypothetical protein
MAFFTDCITPHPSGTTTISQIKITFIFVGFMMFF